MAVKKKGGASVSKLEMLHEYLTDYFIERLRSSKPDPNAEPDYDEEGNELEPFFIPLNAAEIGVIVTFLKNNEITASPAVAHMAELASEFKDDIAEARRTRNAEAITKVQANDQALQDVLFN